MQSALLLAILEGRHLPVGPHSLASFAARFSVLRPVVAGYRPKPQLTSCWREVRFPWHLHARRQANCDGPRHRHDPDRQYGDVAVRPLPRPAIEAVAAISAIGATWPETWAGLLSGRSGISRYVDIDSRFKVDCPVAAIPDLDRHADPYGTGPSMRLASRLFPGRFIAPTGRREYWRQ